VNLLVDINVLLDLVQQRQEFARPAAELFAAVETRRAVAYVAGHSITTAYYIIRRSDGPEVADHAVAGLLRVLDVVPVERRDLLRALTLGWRDFEDAVQAVCAEKIGAEFIVSRDPADFRESLVPVIAPQDAVERLQS
jgi:predicted nucleic acid-binding protein